MLRSSLFLSILFISFYSCKPTLQSTAFTVQNSFTEGIEGPATDADGNIYAVNFAEQGTIGKVTPDGNTSLFVKLPNGSIGNGIRFGSENQMFVADYINHAVLEVDMTTKAISNYAQEPTANQPNDIAIAPDGTLYASDPKWADNTGKLWKVTKENGFELLEENMGTTNGVEVSPDGKNLYINESVQRKVWIYTINDQGGIKDKKLFYEFPDFGLDGMRCHPNGELYITRYGKGTVAVLSKEGILTKEYKLLGKKVSNLTFSPDYQFIYVTMADTGQLEKVKISTP